MLPIYWRYILAPFFKTFFLSVISFVVLIFVVRLKEIAEFAASGPPLKTLILYTLFQIPYILPFAIIFCILLSSFLVFQRMSITNELTALRASGISLRALITPVVSVSFLLGCVNFFVVSELTTAGSIRASIMSYELTQLNPILYFQNSHLLRSHGVYGDLKIVDSAEHVQNVVLATYLPDQERISLLLAKELYQEKTELHGKDITIINSSPPESPPNFDNLLIENQRTLNSPNSLFAWFFKPKKFRPKKEYLKLSLLQLQIKKTRERYLQAKRQQQPANHIKRLREKANEPISELFRRLSLALSSVSLALLGVTFGTTINRSHSIKGLIPVLVLTTAMITCFLVAKRNDHNLLYSGALYFGPLLCMGLVTTYALRRLTKGRT